MQLSMLITLTDDILEHLDWLSSRIAGHNSNEAVFCRQHAHVM